MAIEKVDDRIMTLNVGPQHPGSGHMRLVIRVDGDYIVSCDPDPGYVHRGEEKDGRVQELYPEHTAS